jgi:hypothetical protein
MARLLRLLHQNVKIIVVGMMHLLLLPPERQLMPAHLLLLLNLLLLPHHSRIRHFLQWVHLPWVRLPSRRLQGPEVAVQSPLLLQVIVDLEHQRESHSMFDHPQLLHHPLLLMEE